MLRERAAALAFALLLPGCGGDQAVESDGEEFAGDAVVDEGLMVAEPDAVPPGGEVEVRFPEGDTRGPGFAVERRAGGEWALEWVAHHDPADPEPRWRSAEDWREGGASFDAGPAFDGPGSHRVPVPDEAEPGAYRVCTSDSSAERGGRLCAEFEVVP